MGDSRDWRALATPATYRPESQGGESTIHPSAGVLVDESARAGLLGSPPPRVLVLPYPPSANHYWRLMRAGRGPEARAMIVRTREALEYRARVSAICSSLEPLSGPVSVVVSVWRPRRAGDLDNCLKVLFDALQGHAYHNDSQVEHVEARRFDDKGNPRAEVEVRALAQGQGALL